MGCLYVGDSGSNEWSPGEFRRSGAGGASSDWDRLADQRRSLVIPEPPQLALTSRTKPSNLFLEFTTLTLFVGTRR